MNKVYQIVNEKILEGLRQGQIPWRKPWAVNDILTFHRNVITKKPYRGINVILLSLACQANKNYHKLWLTYRQAKQLGGFIYKNSKPQLVVYWSLYIKLNGKLVKLQDIQDFIDDNEDKEIIPILRYYNVFNIANLGPDDLRKKIIKRFEDIANNTKKIDPIDRAEKIVEKYIDKPPIYQEDIDKAYYSLFRDEIHLPKRDYFISAEEYYSTLFHEMVHSTGHPKRLARLNSNYTHEDYSLEELTAEIGSAYLLNIANIDIEAVTKNNIAYIQCWYRQLSNNPKWITWAASRAQKAVDYILRIKQKID